MALSLAKVVLERTEALRLLEEAYDAQLGIDGRGTRVLQSVLEIARAKGFYASLELAAGMLQVSGRFLVEKGAGGKWVVVRQCNTPARNAAQPCTALVPISTERRSTALVLVAASQQPGPDSFLKNVA
jgi:hypothetical protein